MDQGLLFPSTGVVSLTVAADYETLTTYSFYITATDASGNESVTNTFTVAVNDLDEDAPVLTSSIVSSIDEGDSALDQFQPMSL